MIHIHVLRYLPILGFALIMLWLIIKKWDFVSSSMSDKGEPSATRVAGMILIITVAFCEIYTTFRTQIFDYKHLVALEFGIGVLFGFIKVMDAFSIYKTGKTSEEIKKENEPEITKTKQTTFIDTSTTVLKS